MSQEAPKDVSPPVTVISIIVCVGFIGGVVFFVYAAGKAMEWW